MEVHMSARVGVLLSGCGVLDGSEIHEAVSILISLDRRGAETICIAPNIAQAEVINHLTRKPEAGVRRNVLVESARIARSKIRDLSEITAADLDALIFPGGFGAAKNLCDFASKAEHCTVNKDVARLLNQMHEAKKPIGLACISPVLAAQVFGAAGLKPRLTIGSDPPTAAAIEAMGGVHHPVGPAEVHIDEENLLVSTPCYMNDVGPWVVFQGVERMVEEVLRLTGDRASIVRSHMAGMEPRHGADAE
jgi:enhancing lycopene biosynthesis protein 2